MGNFGEMTGFYRGQDSSDYAELARAANLLPIAKLWKLVGLLKGRDWRYSRGFFIVKKSHKKTKTNNSLK